jgi:hypothetical protein
MTDDTSGLEPGTTRTPTWAWIVIAVLGAALVFTTTFGVIQWRRADDLGQKQSQRRAAAATAAQFAAALYTYDYNDLAAAKARIVRLVTPAYAKGYDASSAAEQATITRLKARQTAKASGVFLTDVVKDHVAAVVVLNSSLQSAGGNRNSVTYLDVALVRQGSAWKVNVARAVPVSP